MGIWLHSGHLTKRGKCKGCYQMARHGDQGAYAVDNVAIIRIEENSSAGTKGKVFSAEHRAALSANKKRFYAEHPEAVERTAALGRSKAGKQLSDEHRKKTAATMRAHWADPAQRAAMLAARKR